MKRVQSYYSNNNYIENIVNKTINKIHRVVGENID